MYVIKWMMLYPQSDAKVWEGEDGKPAVFEDRDQALAECGRLLDEPEYATLGLSFWVENWKDGEELQ